MGMSRRQIVTQIWRAEEGHWRETSQVLTLEEKNGTEFLVFASASLSQALVRNSSSPNRKPVLFVAEEPQDRRLGRNSIRKRCTEEGVQILSIRSF